MGLQQVGDIWLNILMATCRRAVDSLKVSKAQGHAAYQDVSEGKHAMRHNSGNDKADELVVRGSEGHAGSLFFKVAHLINTRQFDYAKFMGKGHQAINAVLFIKRKKETTGRNSRRQHKAMMRRVKPSPPRGYECTKQTRKIPSY